MSDQYGHFFENFDKMMNYLKYSWIQELFNAKINTAVKNKRKYLDEKPCERYYIGLHKRRNSSIH
jgi:hypothetical protein